VPHIHMHLTAMCLSAFCGCGQAVNSGDLEIYRSVLEELRSLPAFRARAGQLGRPKDVHEPRSRFHVKVKGMGRPAKTKRQQQQQRKRKGIEIRGSGIDID